MAITKEELKNALFNYFKGAEIEIKDLAGDDDHWEVYICDSSFNGMPLISQHRMVQDAVKDYEIHALSIKTKAKV